MDDDFQNPPAEALKLLTYSINNKFDVVYGDYRKKKHSFLRNFMSKINDISANYILNKPKENLGNKSTRQMGNGNEVMIKNKNITINEKTHNVFTKR